MNVVLICSDNIILEMKNCFKYKNKGHPPEFTNHIIHKNILTISLKGIIVEENLFHDGIFLGQLNCVGCMITNFKFESLLLTCCLFSSSNLIP